MDAAETIVCHKWAPIEDLPSDADTLSSGELRVLAQVWAEQIGLLQSPETLRDFNERLQREWAIETGVIERVYTLDRGVTQLLIERGINASLIPHSATDKDPQLVAAMIRDHEEAIESLFDFVKGNRPLSTGYIKELHALITRHQETAAAVNTLGRQVEIPLTKGEYKSLPNNPVTTEGSLHEYCPPEHVASEMERLVQLHHEHTGAGIPPDVEASWLHHRFSQVHPFQDGNGRVARALATLILIRERWFPLVVTRDDRDRYISALEAADDGDLRSLIEFVGAAERRAFVKALGVAGEVLQKERVDQVIDAARDLLEKRQETLRLHWENAKGTARSLQEAAIRQMNGVAGKLKAELGYLLSRHYFTVDSESHGGSRDYYFRSQIIQTARALDYFANPSIFKSWVRLVIRAETQTEILLSFHGIGHEFRGVIVAAMCYFRREYTEEKEREVTDVVPLSDEVFQVNYLEQPEDVEERFEAWVNRGLVKGLDLWSQSL